MIPVKIHTEYITLQQLLKLQNHISSGGEAKYFLQEQDVFVNGVIERRRGKKLFSKDKIRIADLEYEIV